MTKNELAKELAVSEKLTLTTAFKAIDGAIRIMKESLAKGNDIVLRGFGTLAVVECKQRNAVNFATKEPIVIPAHKTIKFKPGQDLKDLCAGTDRKEVEK